MTTLHSPFNFKQPVHIDNDDSITAYVTGFEFWLDKTPFIQVSYIHNGINYSPWIEEWRISAKPTAAKNPAEP